jgi:hypothetical protein
MKFFTVEVLQLIAVGSLGAIVHAFSHLMNHRKNNLDYSWTDFAVYFIFGGFAGVMFGLVGQWIFEGQIERLFFTGMGAFMGFAGLNALSIWALKRLGVNPEYYVNKD